MSKLFGKIVGIAVVAAGAYAVGKYLNDYTDYKAAGDEDLDQLKNGGEKAKEAAKRTYIAIRSNTDVTEPAGELGRAAAEVAEGAGKLVTAVGTNTMNFVKSEKEKYAADPRAYKEQVGENLKEMGQQAAEIFNTVKEDASNIVSEVKTTAEGFRNDPQDFVQTDTAPVQQETESSGKVPESEEKKDPESDKNIVVSVDTEELK